MGLIITVLLAKALQAIFFGSLRAIEVEHLYERSWYAVTETCLAMTIFREDFDLQFIVYFTLLLFLKIFHWLCQDRVEFMEQSPIRQASFHIRILNLLALLLVIDIAMANHALHVTLTKGPSMMIMFGFEYTILIFVIISTTGKYILNIIDMTSEQTWEGKSMLVFYLDLITDFFKLITYSLFFIYICLNYQLPLHIIRDVYVTFKSFIQKCTDLYRYRRATRNMNELYPNATAEDFSRSNDRTCIICREEMHIADNNETPNEANADATLNRNEQNHDQAKKLPCGHIFHFNCLRSWLERQQTCPTCRRSVLADNSNSSSQENNDVQQQDQQQQQQQQQQQPNLQNDPSRINLSAPIGIGNENRNEQGQTLLSTQNIQSMLFNPTSAQATTLPAMIPLTPSTSQTHVGLPSYPDSLAGTVPSELTEEQLKTMSCITRESLIAQLKLLGDVQNQIFNSMQVLTQALSIIPDISNMPSNEQSNSADKKQEASASSTSNESYKTPDDEDHEEDVSSRRKEKMPDRTYNTTLSSEQEELTFSDS
ncbi:hypothetical protein G6F70_007043 [Rhizopus microsporus]|nr:hypothetical protein G6F71_000114 [Rhizopus microsporus]KAG1196926.1 hypothetical protein G6F70_007043 [Rhizopus microsporus]KAG1206036.1 hypothetical protein G6F69_009119 [Rhizopus microsporus]KAG1226114.1 hypothetical protein G6F67_009106 [Rhizopus microsporus]KAG1257527.1 hypothetical protein G6F68_009263 [Rhizopus microsporus]